MRPANGYFMAMLPVLAALATTKVSHTRAAAWPGTAQISRYLPALLAAMGTFSRRYITIGTRAVAGTSCSRRSCHCCACATSRYWLDRRTDSSFRGRGALGSHDYLTK